MTIALSDIHVADLEAGFVQLKSGLRYRVSQRPFASAYIAETGPIEVAVDGRAAITVPLGGHCSLPSGAAHSISLPGSFNATRTIELRPPFARSPGDPADGTRLFAAMVSTSVNPLPEIVPDILVLTRAQMQSVNGLDLMFQLLRNLVVTRPDTRSSITSRLAEIVAITLLEHVLERADDPQLLAFAQLSDIQVRRAVSALHGSPDQDWSLERLARHAGMSRSVLAERFKQLMGYAPMEYLARVRISRASRLLKAQDLSISEIAFRSGYGSDAAFHKAFKRMTGNSPGFYRKLHMQQ